MQDMLCARMPDNLLAKIICSLILHPYSLAAHSKLKSSARPCNVLCVWHRGRTCIQLCMQGQPGQRRVEFKPCMHDQAAIGLFLGDMLICSEVGCRYFMFRLYSTYLLVCFRGTCKGRKSFLVSIRLGLPGCRAGR